MTYAEAMERYGSDKPDLRFGMPIADVTEEMSTLGLDTFPGLIEGGRAGARDRAARRRRRLRHAPAQDQRGAVAGRASCPTPAPTKRNLFTLKATDEAVGNLVQEGRERGGGPAPAARRSGAAKDDTVLVGIDAPEPLAMAMGILRLEMGRELKLVDEKAFRFLWVTDFPLFDYDAGEKRYVSLHHPFTAPRDEDVALLDTDPGRCGPRPTTSC